MTDHDRFEWRAVTTIAMIACGAIAFTGCAESDKPWGSGTVYMDRAEYCTDMRDQCAGNLGWQRAKALPDNPAGFLEAVEPESCRAFKRDCR